MPQRKPAGEPTLRLHPPAPPDLDPFTAKRSVLKQHGLPLRPDPQLQPGMAALWDRQADRYRNFEHLEPQPDTSTASKKNTAALGPFDPAPIESCGYSFTSQAAPFTALFITWTVPNLRFSPSPLSPNRFHTFVGLGFLDVHVEMTVDSANKVTSHLWAQGVGNVNLPVFPGDVLSASLCLDTKPPGTAHYFFANETSTQTMNFSLNTGFPPAQSINAGVTREDLNLPVHPLAHFGIVYFDEISAYTTNGSVSLTSGNAITMVDHDGSTLARPIRISDFTFKTIFVKV
jgi:hypothetical protein